MATPDVSITLASNLEKLLIAETMGEWNQAVKELEGEAKRLVPVRSGELRDSITGEVATEGNEVVVLASSPVEHAGFVEYGTSRQRPQPYLRPALVKTIRRRYR